MALNITIKQVSHKKIIYSTPSPTSSCNIHHNSTLYIYDCFAHVLRYYVHIDAKIFTLGIK